MLNPYRGDWIGWALGLIVLAAIGRDWGVDTMTGLATMTKTYPPHIEELRQSWLEVLSQIQAKYEGSPQDASKATEITMSRFPSTQEEYARVHRAYRDEIAPILKELADLEGYATISMTIPASGLGCDR